MAPPTPTTETPTEVAARIEAELRAAGTPERAEQERRYLKSPLEHFGTSVPATRKVAKGAGRLDHDDLIAVAEALWARPIHECRAAAVELLDLHGAELGPADLALIERLIRESGTWALVDGLAASVAGPLVERHPELLAELDRWAADDDFWVRRSALLALLLALRRGEGDFERFGAYADSMLEEREFFIRKAIGWVLRDTAKMRPDMVYAWLLPRAERASGLTRREAMKPMSAAQRATIVAAAQARSATRSGPRSRARRDDEPGPPERGAQHPP
ncbi:MAG: DNA alkylation repair protein [Solirubrobacteraceae bacterium]|nr:DNA alkylation repair protein [Solirubrobacteraceae bacterium]